MNLTRLDRHLWELDYDVREINGGDVISVPPSNQFMTTVYLTLWCVMKCHQGNKKLHETIMFQPTNVCIHDKSSMGLLFYEVISNIFN